MWVISSESCSFVSVGAKYVREVQPGEIIEITKRGVQTVSIVERPNNSPSAFCIFEYIYFARADSILQGKFIKNFFSLSLEVFQKAFQK